MDQDPIMHTESGILFLDNMGQKFGLKEYKKATPAKWRKLGDALLATSAMAMGYAALTKHETLTLVFIIVGIGGKFLTNFFSEDAVVESETSSPEEDNA